MVTKTEIDIAEVWKAFKEDQSSQELRNRLIERYLPLVRYNAERVWAKLPDGVDLPAEFAGELENGGLLGPIECLHHDLELF